MVEMAGLRWWNWLVCDGEIGCFYSSANTVKAERVHARAFSGREEAALGMIEHIECLCNGIGIRSALGRLSPEEFEKKQMEESRRKAA